MKLSIIIPMYNAAGHIVRCLSSIAKQNISQDEYEVIMVDDCSTDNSYFIAERFETDFKNFKVVKTEHNSGPGGARNRGVKEATGEYLFLVDCDDYIPEHGLERIFSVLEKNTDIVLYPYMTLREKDSKRPGGNTVPKISKIEELGNCPVGPWVKVFKRELYPQMPENILSEDTAWSFLLYDKCNTLAVVEGEEPCYVYDRSVATAITDTVEWCGMHSYTMEQLAFEDLAIKANKNDKWISDVIRNFANMYDIRNKLTKPYIKAAWANRFKGEYSNLMTGHYCH